MYRILPFLTVIFLVSCYDTVDKIQRIDKAPDLSTISLYLPEQDSKNGKWCKELHVSSTNSLWYSNSAQFFKDNRPWNVGDLIRIIISIDDSAELNNSTSRKRNSGRNLGLTNLLGIENAIKSISENTVNPSSLVNTKSDSKHTGDGSISRAEDINTEIAATVIKVLQNGNLLIRGHQEIRVNHELRQIKVSGIIRAKDITSANSINFNQIAEARISYGGKGVISDVQQPTLGNQILNIFLPF